MTTKILHRKMPSSQRVGRLAGHYACLLGAVLVTVSAAQAGTTNREGYAESFETYTNGFVILGTNGWGGLNPDAGTVTTSVVDNAGTYPLPGATHTNVLQVTDEITNTLVCSTGGVVVLDFMAMPTVAQWAPTVDASWHYAFYVNNSSNLVLWHYNPTGVSNEWTTLAGGPAVTNGAWTRFTVQQDYGHSLFQMKVNNGAWITDPKGWTGAGGSPGGSWFYLAQTGGVIPTNMNGFGIAESETNYVDDIVLTNRLLTLSANAFLASGTNNGTVSNSISINLLYDTFNGALGDDFVASNKLQVANLPSNMTAVATYASANQLVLSLAGAATNHEAINSTNLLITLLSSAFTLGNAPDVNGYTNTLALTFRNTPALSYSTNSFTESFSPNDGSIDNSNPLVITLTNAFFAGTVGADFCQQGKVQVGNLPSNLVAVITLTNQTQLSVTLTNKASANDPANDVPNLTFIFNSTAFSNVQAVGVQGITNSSLQIHFWPNSKNLQYGVTTFVESSANDGSVAGTSTVSLTGPSLAGTNGEDLVASGRVAVSNVPGGLTLQLVENSAQTMTLQFIGSASNNLAINTISNLTVTFTDNAFTGGGASSVTNYSMTNLVVQFHDQPGLGWGSTTFTEATANDGSIGTTNTVTLSDPNGVATFTGGAYTAGSQYTVAGVPEGLTCVVWNAGASTVKVALSGNAVSNASANNTSLTLQFQNAAFATVGASHITGTLTNLAVVFHDQPSLSWDSTTFTEATANDGSIGTTNTVTLSDPNGVATFTGAAYTSGSQYTVSGVPAGLTCVVWNVSASTVKVALSGNAVSNASANNTSFTLQFQNAAFATVGASYITGSSTNLAVQFNDPVILTYSGDTFYESAGGAIDNSTPITISLVNDTLTGANGDDFVAGHKVTVSNLPNGLTAVITRANLSQLNITLTGAAFYSDEQNDVTNLTLQFKDTAFAHAAAALVVNGFVANLKINFTNDTPFAYQVPYVEPFEQYANGAWMTLVTNGWSAEYAGAGMVSNHNSVGNWNHAYQGPVPVTATHTNELYVQSDLASEIHSIPGQMVYTDFSAWPTPMVDAPQVSTSMQYAFYVSTNGQFVIWHQNRAGGGTNNVLRVLTNAPAIDTNRWLRITICQDYSNSMFQIRLNNGDPITDAEGWTGPGGTTNGSWFYMVQTNHYMTGFGIAGVGSGYVDDLTVRTNLQNQTPVTLALAPKVFHEAMANDGSIDNGSSNRITLVDAIGVTFAGNNGDAYGAGSVQASNLPPDLTAVLGRTSPTNLSVSLMGRAVNNFSRDNVSNVVISILDGAFNIGSANIAGAANIIGASQSGLQIDFEDGVGSVYLIR